MVQPDVAFYAWDHFNLPKHVNSSNGYAKTMVLPQCRQHVSIQALTTVPYPQPFTHLKILLIAFDAFSGTERKLFVPRELLKNLKKAVAQPESEEGEVPPGLVTLDTPPQSIHNGNMLVILYDLATIIGAMFQQNIEPTQANQVKCRSELRISYNRSPAGQATH